VVALLPGSRASEVHYLASRFFKAAALIHKENSAIKFVVPAVPNLKPQIDALAAECGLGSALTVVQGQSHAVLAACDVTLIASGTATLEAALFKRPMVIAYNMNWISWQMMRRKRLQPWVGLPNILCQDMVVPELLQDEATPQAMAREVLAWLKDGARTLRTQQRFAALHAELMRDTVGLSLGVMEQLIEQRTQAPCDAKKTS
jgi:lipid-A-disaccharide synthase